MAAAANSSTQQFSAAAKSIAGLKKEFQMETAGLDSEAMRLAGSWRTVGFEKCELIFVKDVSGSSANSVAVKSKSAYSIWSRRPRGIACCRRTDQQRLVYSASPERGSSLMITITAVIRVKKGHEATMREALLDVAKHVKQNEPETVGFFISQAENDPCVFTTYERFTDHGAMDRHNSSDVVARFFAIAKPILDGDVVLVTSGEIDAKNEG